MERIKWYFKQLLPLKYKGTHTENGNRVYTEWRMWFGICFNIESTIIGKAKDE